MLAQAFFPEQLTDHFFATNLLYMIATASVVILIVGLTLIDVGIVRRANVIDTAVQKIVGALIGALSFAIIGFGIWNWQFYDAFGVSNPYWTAIKDWWFAGTGLVSFSQELDPVAFPAADNLQIFVAFNMVFAAVVCALIHAIGIERMKASAYYVMCAGVGGIFFPVLLWLTWGSTSPLTTRGVHDYVGGYVAYTFLAVFGLILAWRLGPRLSQPKYNSLSLTMVGVGVVMFAIPLLVMGCGYFFTEAGYFGISMSSSGFGIAFVNAYVAMCGGVLGGALISYKTKNVVPVMLGPISGYISGTAMLDIVAPWEMLVVSFFAPFFVLGVSKLLKRWNIDEVKVIPLALGAGVYGVIVTGLVAWGTPTGGFIGIEEGTFAFQNAEVNLGWQLIGLLATVGITLVAAAVLIFGVEKTIGLRVKEQDESEGLDSSYWNQKDSDAR